MNSTLDCPICIINFNNTNRFPMIVGKCGHTICRECSPDLKQCPICRQPIRLENMIKNYALLEKIPSKLEIVKGLPNPPPYQQPAMMQQFTQQPAPNSTTQQFVDCPNGHPCLWRGQLSKCSACLKRQSFGWHCLDCKYLKCDQCVNTQFSNNQCPNGHKTTWVGQISMKSLPYKLTKPLWVTQPNSTEHRKACSNQKHYVNKFRKDLVLPHPFVYSLQEKNKKPKLGGWLCYQCLYIRCKFCDMTFYQKDVCPNGHKNIWFGEEKQCASCSTLTGGWRCQQCKFNQCDKCYNRVMDQLVKKTVTHSDQAHCCKLM